MFQVIGTHYIKHGHVMDLFILFDDGSHNPLIQLFDSLFFTHLCAHGMYSRPIKIISPLMFFVYTLIKIALRNFPLQK